MVSGTPGKVLHGESSKRLATPRNTKDKKHLQSTQSAQTTNLTDQAPSTTERTARETHNTKYPWQGVTKVTNSTDVNRTVRFSDRLQRRRTGCNRDRPDDHPSLAACAILALLA